MTRTLIIAAREVRERRFVFAVAAFISMIPFIVLNLRASRRAGGFEMIGFVGTIAGFSFAIALAMILGSSIVGRELTERRLSFYFARPVSAASIWFGKLTGGVVLMAISFGIIFLPSFLAARHTWEKGLNVPPAAVAGLAVGGALMIFLLSHALSTIIRSRSGFAAVDLIAATLVAGAAWVILSSLIGAMALALTRFIAVTFMVMVAVTLIAAGVWQLSRGRTDLKRSHIEMSKFLWITLALTVAILGAYTAWVFAADVTDLDKAQAFQSSRGDWAQVEGSSRFRGDFHAVFLLNLASGQSFRFPAARWSGPNFTRNGDATFAEATPLGWRGKTLSEVVLHRFGRDDRRVQTGIAEGGSVVLSDDLNRLAVIGNRTVSIHEIDTQRLIASAPMPQPRPWQVRAFFVTPDVLRMIFMEREKSANDVAPLRFVIAELNATKRQMIVTGSWTTTGTGVSVQASGDGATLLVNRLGKVEGSRIVLLDGRTGALRTALPVESGGYWSTRMLADGRVAVISDAPERSLQLFSADGSLLRQIPLGRAARVGIGNETTSGQLIVRLYAKEKWEGAGGRGWETVVVDLAGGRVTRRERDVVPQYHFWSVDPRVPARNATGEIVVSDATGALWRWNVTTGVKKKLI